MSDRAVYILNDLNGALIKENSKWFYYDRLSGDLNEIDHVLLAQLKSLKPDTQPLDLSKEKFRLFRSRESTLDSYTHFTRDIPLLTEVISTHLKAYRNNNPSRALQLMDGKLSTEYRRALLGLMRRDIQQNEDILPALYLLLYSQILPKAFSPIQAMEVLGDTFPVLREIYAELSENSKALAMIHSILKSELPLSLEDWQPIDACLVENGFYFNLAAAIRLRSDYLFRYTFERLGKWETDERSNSFISLQEDIVQNVISRLSASYNCTLDVDDWRLSVITPFSSVSKWHLLTENTYFLTAYDALINLEETVDIKRYFDLVLFEFGPYSSRFADEPMVNLVNDINACSEYRPGRRKKTRRRWNSLLLGPLSPPADADTAATADFFSYAKKHTVTVKTHNALNRLWLVSSLDYTFGKTRTVKQNLLKFIFDLEERVIAIPHNYALRLHLLLAKFRLAFVDSRHQGRLSETYLADCLDELADLNGLNQRHHWIYLDADRVANLIKAKILLFRQSSPRPANDPPPQSEPTAKATPKAAATRSPTPKRTSSGEDDRVDD